jgi:hypothetical protein
MSLCWFAGSGVILHPSTLRATVKDYCVDILQQPQSVPYQTVHHPGASLAIPAVHLFLGRAVLPFVFVLLENGMYATLMGEAIYFRGGHGQHGEAIRSGMERLVAVFERAISQYPDQWYNFYDFFGKVYASDKTHKWHINGEIQD